MNGLDLFSGIGGLTKALQGYVRPVAYCEIGRYAQAVLLSRMSDGTLPTCPIWDDVRTLRGEYIAADIDIIYGGFPCQDISVAGRGAGLDAERSGLFFEIIRLVGEIRPRFVFLENVPAIRTRGADIVVKELARLRHDSRWGVLSASDVGANHRRERWWLLAYRQCEGLERHARDGKDTTGRQKQNGSVSPRRVREDVADSESQQDRRLFKPAISPNAGTNGNGREKASWWAVEPDVGRVANGVPFRVDRLKCLGNSVVPAQAREAFERLMGLKGDRVNGVA